MLGTSHYIAPEQARGERVDAQTDVYSFGVVLYELLAGEVPYPGDNFLTVAMKHVNEPVPSVLERRPDTPLRLASLIERCMAKLPADRPASMDEVVSELESVRSELDAKDGGEATMIVKPKPAPKRPARHARTAQARSRSGRLSLGLLLLAAVIGGILLAEPGRDDPGGAAAGDPVQLRGVASFDPPPATARSTANASRTRPTATRRPTGRRSGTARSRSRASASCSTPARARELSQIAVTTDTPGFTAEIRAGDSPEGPFDTVVGPSQHGRARARPGISTGRTPGTTSSGSPSSTGSAHVNEVEAS